MNSNHLTHHQICDLLIDPAQQDAAAVAHLAACPACTSELASLSTGLRNFQQASIRLAELEIARRPTPLLPAARSRSFFAVPAFAAAAALLLAIVFLPQHRTPAPDPHAHQAALTPAVAVSDAESDEALLNQIDQDLDASIPSAMEPLAGPTDTASSQSTAQGDRQ